MLASSTDDGATFSDPVNISNSEEFSSTFPQLAVSGSNVHVVWQENDDVLLASSSDNGVTFSDPAAIVSDGLPASPQIATSGSSVLVAWEDNGEIMLASSTDDGATFSDPVNISNSEEFSAAPAIRLASGGNAHVAWREANADESNYEIYLSTIPDGGSPSECPIDVSSNSGSSFSPKMALAADDSRLHIVWEDSTTGVFEVQIQHNIDPLEPVAVINPISAESLKVGQTLEISGSAANFAPDDKIEVDWGDDESDQVPIEGCFWGPVDHAYDGAAVGKNQLVANLLAPDDTLKASSVSKEIAVQKGLPLLTLDPVAHVFVDTTMTVSGKLVDSETLNPIANAPISFSGSGAAGLAAETTNEFGEFEANGQAPDTASDGLTVQAHFEGDDFYESEDSEIGLFDTIDPAAEQYTVPAGSNTIPLSNFSATIELEDIPEEGSGSLYVSECTSTPTSDRFIALDACLRISPAFQLTEGKPATITMSFDAEDIPEGHSVSELGMFRETTLSDGSKSVTDITASLTNDIVTGVTSGFSNFIIGVATPPDPDPGVHLSRVLIGDDNIVSLRDIDNPVNSSDTASIEFDRSSYEISDEPVITITDDNGNVDPAITDTIFAKVKSDTSDPFFIVVTLEETGPDTNIFEKAFDLTTQASVFDGGPLKTEEGDSFSVDYASGGRFTGEIDGVTEAGSVGLSDFRVGIGECFVPIGGALNLQLVDASLSVDATIEVTMSYANAILKGRDLSELILIHREGDTWIDITASTDQGTKTLTGISTSPEGPYSLAADFGSCGGGAGGGFGKGLVVDAVASVARASSSDGGSGGGGGRSAPPVYASQGPTVQSGQEVTVSEDLQPGSGNLGGRVTINFENVITPGTLNIEEDQLTSSQTMFTSVESGHGRFNSDDGASFATAGPIIDITPSGLQFQGTVDVTIPYSEALASSALGVEGNSAEQNVRFLHFDGAMWQDLTVSIDTTANTVTGRMSTFSPVVAAVVQDGSFGNQYFLENPMKRLAPVLSGDASPAGISFSDSAGSPVAAVSAGQEVTVVTALKNNQRIQQDYVYIVQVLDSRGVAVAIDMLTSSLAPGQETTIQDISFRGEGGEQQAYTVKVFLVSVGDSPELLSEAITAQIPVAKES
jgi:hypothetical protein